jgi:hypothetical protein
VTRVRIAHAVPDTTGTATVNSRHDLGNGVVVVHPTPGHGGEGIARDVLQALGKRFRERTPRDPRRLQALAAIWLRAERTGELVIAGADRRRAADWRVLRDLCSETLARLTFVVERRPNRDQVAALGEEADISELTVSELVYGRLPLATDPNGWWFSYQSGSPDEYPGYPPVPDVDFAYFPSACNDLLPEHEAARVLLTFERARALTMLWFELCRGSEPRHGPGPRHAHAFLDTLIAPCVTVDGAITMLRGAQASFLLGGILLQIDPDQFAADHQAHAGAPATTTTAALLRSYVEPHLAAAGALASATRANAEQLAELTLGSVARTGATFASGHRINPPFQALVAAQALARRAAGADDGDPLFLTPDQTRPATPRHLHNMLERIGRQTGLRFDTTTGWNRYAPRPWATLPRDRDRRPAYRLNGRSSDPPRRLAPFHGPEETARAGRDRPALGYPAHMLNRHRTADDRAIEAILASTREPCTASQLAIGLNWALPRTIDALEHLEAALQNTGQILTRLGHHTYQLSPQPGFPHHREIARCMRHTRDPIDLATAAVLHRALTCSPPDRSRDRLSTPADRAAADRLLAAGLLRDDDGVLRPTPRAEATFRAPPEPRDLY